MTSDNRTCPSSQPDQEGAQVLGVVERGADGPALSYVNAHVPVTDEVLAATGEVPPTLIYRFAAPCVESKCKHFDGSKCQLAVRIAAGLAPTVDKLPPCAIRKTCRWYVQEGASACGRCPQVVTQVTDEEDPLFRIAQPDAEMAVAED
ncbi:hypothetical protein RXV86_07490 [Alisedimentitalea sp. MJ-SS2]|uniref:hypothetical protein n=1 Tax=Aliisedimentitalea sp. MJ-SS2 TaxID=3049795 RepID=UPI002908EFB9|nr:hypothetical protein [Alisedimentitalea sp. MJ-SS2]MDU8927223.1 hypothetical protein [Alisedimentitalea sp. MJ-SS2]